MAFRRPARRHSTIEPRADMLFAEVTVGEVGGVAGVVGGVLGFLSVAVTGYFAFAANRDKLRYDANMIRLQADNDRLTEAEKECRQDHTELKAEVVKLATRLDAERDRSADERGKLEMEINKQRDLKHEMNGRLMALQSQLHMQGVTVDLRPLKDGSGTMPKPPPAIPPSDPNHPF